MVKTIYPHGHFYSPLVNNDEVRQMQDRIWPAAPHISGIDFNDNEHRRIIESDFRRYSPAFCYPMGVTPGMSSHDYYLQNSHFGGLDALALFSFLQMWRPQRLVELGSGYSTLLMVDINRRFLNGDLAITCIDPYPLSFLQRGIPGVKDFFPLKITEVPLELFSILEKDDILFIDTSHVSKTGSDVNHIYFEILPRLKPGVIIHIHDIFFPEDYPKSWVIEEGRNWNEQYLVRALLMYSSVFKVLFGCYNAFYNYPELVAGLFGGTLYSGGSLWIRKIA